ncbi:MAG: magnesium protoporphyrin IX methyltransferase [Polyangiaceae bacterium]|jgi:magnesium-protoporphyrin O-methyltransferase|nr:magnesium protoporphyrin IX methyltransferase [Polyangiaceae bacterium]
MINTSTYEAQRQKIETYFDRTAVDAWAKLTSDEPVGRIRSTVRAGRDRMRALLLASMPEDLRGRRVLDAGCGTGALAVECARRGASVVAIDLSANLVALARDRAPRDLGAGSIEFRAADMLDPSLGHFDWIVAMDSLIHYDAADLAEALGHLAPRARSGLSFSFAPWTPLLSLMHLVGRMLPGSDRAPAIAPISEKDLRQRIARHEGLVGFEVARTERVDSGFYMSQAMELVRR